MAGPCWRRRQVRSWLWQRCLCTAAQIAHACLPAASLHLFLHPLPAAVHPGQLDERSAQGLDFILAEAAKYGVRLMPVLLNLWKYNNGVPQFEEWWVGWGNRRLPLVPPHPRAPCASTPARAAGVAPRAPMSSPGPTLTSAPRATSMHQNGCRRRTSG